MLELALHAAFASSTTHRDERARSRLRARARGRRRRQRGEEAKTTPKPKAASKPKAKAVKDQPHVVIEVPHNGPSGQSIKRSYGRLKILGMYPDKARAERAAKVYIQRNGGEVEAFGTGYPNIEGDTWDSQLQVIVKHAGEMIG